MTRSRYPLTPEPAVPAGLRYADFVLSPDGTEIWCVCEGHIAPPDLNPEDPETPGEPAADDAPGIRRAIVAVPLDGSAADDAGAIRELVTGADFLASPAPSPGGGHLAWIAVGPPADAVGRHRAARRRPRRGRRRRSRPARCRAASSESVLQPEWRDDDTLYVICDRPGWWNLYQVGLPAGSPQAALPGRGGVRPAAVAARRARPYAPLADGRLAVLHGAGDCALGVLDPATRRADRPRPALPPYWPTLPPRRPTIVGIAGGGPSRPTVGRPVDAAHRPASSGAAPPAGRAARPGVPAEPRSIERLPGPDGRPVHAHVYPPANPDAVGAGRRAARRTWCSCTAARPGTRRSTLDLKIGVLHQPRHRRRRRQLRRLDRLRPRVPRTGCAASGASSTSRTASPRRRPWSTRGDRRPGAARDPRRLGRRLDDAGRADRRPTCSRPARRTSGWPSCCSFAEDTHDFESRYLDGLVGPLPEAATRYVERAPLSHGRPARPAPCCCCRASTTRSCRRRRRELFRDALPAKGFRTPTSTFEGESHGFRKREHRSLRATEAELSFYGQVMGFEPRNVEPIELTTG